MINVKMISVKNLEKTFHTLRGDLHVLKGINQEIQKGEKVVIVGPSGSGKSTFLRCLNLLEMPTGGEVWFEGTQINAPGCDVDQLRRKMGMVFQHFNLFPHLSVLKNNGRNNTILAIPEFRKAISLFLNRDEYNATCYTSHRTCYGLLGPSYYYDVENGGVYRDTQYAKEALLRVYGFTQDDKGIWSDGVNRYPTYEDAYEAMNGMNRTLAKQLVVEAYNEMVGDPGTYGYDSGKQIELKFGTSSDNTNTRRNYEYIKKTIEDLVTGTPLEGKINVTFDASFGTKWSETFRNGEYEIAAGTGFSGGAFDPQGFLQCYLDPEAGLMYSTWWKTDEEEITYTMPEGDYAESGKTLTMSVYNWYCCLNSMAESRGQKYTYNWGAGAAPADVRMEILAMLEEYTLEQYYTIVTTSEYSASLLGAKFSYISGEHNIFMGFGGYRYMIVNYTDSEWTTYANSTDLETEYKKTN